MRVLKIGTDVKIKDIDAKVLGICIRGENNHVTYEVAWWIDGDRHISWVEEYEISDERVEDYMKIGY